jgi:hypothetical protein
MESYTSTASSGFVAEYTSSGAYRWSGLMGESVVDVAASGTNFVATGRMTTTLDLDPGISQRVLTPDDGEQIFLADVAHLDPVPAADPWALLAAIVSIAVCGAFWRQARYR